MALNFQGDRAVGVLNDPKNTFSTDDLFRVYDGGILVAGGVSVDHGDFVSWDGTKWVLEANIKIARSDEISNTNSSIAPNYTKKTYEANSYVMQGGVLYTNPNAIETAEDWNPAHWTQTTVAEMIPEGTSKSNPLMTAEETERMINAMKPIDAMTLRFEFSKKDYNPETAGVGSAGTWAKVDSPTLNVWDWTTDATDWTSAFQGAFPDEDNEVRVIAAGDTSSVTNVSKLFAGVYVSNPGTNGYTLTSRNNVISCVPFDVSNVTDAVDMFHGTALKEIVRFAFNGCPIRQMYSNSYIHDFDEIELSVSSAYGMFSMCFNLVHVGKIKFDPTKLVGTIGQDASLFYALSSYGEMNIETIEGIEGTENVADFTNFMSSNMKKLKSIGGEIDCTSATNCTTMFQNCRALEHAPVMKNLGSSHVTSTYIMFNGCWSLKEAPVFDTSYVTDARNMFSKCYALTEIPDYDFSSVTKVNSFCENSYNVKSGIVETYNKFLDRGESITSHTDCFKDCGRDTPEGRAALAQIPASWGGTGPEPTP